MYIHRYIHRYIPTYLPLYVPTYIPTYLLANKCPYVRMYDYSIPCKC